MTPKETLERFQLLAASGRFFISDHCWVRMRERGAVEDDLLHAMAVAKSCLSQPKDRWQVDSFDMDNDPISMIVTEEAELIFITLTDERYKGDKR